MFRWLKRKPFPMLMPDPDTGFIGSELDVAPIEWGCTHCAESDQALAFYGTVYDAAEHLLRVMGIRGSNGTPIFTLAEEVPEDVRNNELLRHAILDLQAKIEGSTPPPFTYAEMTEH